MAAQSDAHAAFKPVSSWMELPQEFFARPADVVARDLVGKLLWRTGVGGGRLTELEAYLPGGDPASHSFRGQTRRNASMFGPSGHVYCYLSYGVHVLLNLVCDSASVGSAVLVRSFEALGDRSVLESNRLRAARDAGGKPQCGANLDGGSRRNTCGHSRARWLACGPGRVGQALDIGLALDGLPLGRRSGIYVFDDGMRPDVCCHGRVGISKGRDLPLRFVDANSRCVTAAREGGNRG